MWNQANDGAKVGPNQQQFNHTRVILMEIKLQFIQMVESRRDIQHFKINGKLTRRFIGAYSMIENDYQLKKKMVNAIKLT